MISDACTVWEPEEYWEPYVRVDTQNVKVHSPDFMVDAPNVMPNVKVDTQMSR